MKQRYANATRSIEDFERAECEARAEWNLRRAAVRGYLEMVYDPEELQMSAFCEALTSLADAGIRAIGASKECYEARARRTRKVTKKK